MRQDWIDNFPRASDVYWTTVHDMKHLFASRRQYAACPNPEQCVKPASSGFAVRQHAPVNATERGDRTFFSFGLTELPPMKIVAPPWISFYFIRGRDPPSQSRYCFRLSVSFVCLLLRFCTHTLGLCPTPRRHAVDLTSLKRSGGKHKRQNPNRRALNAANNISLAKAKAMATKPAAVGAEPGFFSALSSPPATSVVRRVLSNGRGGFCIATGESTTPSTPFGTTITNGAVASLRTTFSVRLVQEQHEGAVSREEPNQQSNNGCSKRSRVTPDVGGSGRASGEMAGDRTSAEDRLGNAAATGTPALYREAGFVNEGREGRGNTVKASARVRGKGGKAGMGGGAIRNAEGGGGVAGVGKRSLEDMMIGGLACSRH